MSIGELVTLRSQNMFLFWTPLGCNHPKQSLNYNQNSEFRVGIECKANLVLIHLIRGRGGRWYCTRVHMPRTTANV